MEPISAAIGFNSLNGAINIEDANGKRLTGSQFQFLKWCD